MRLIDSIDKLKALFPEPGERALKKELTELDSHCRQFIELSPFVVLATGDDDLFDASPRGGAPGFVRVIDESTLWLPDSPGNNRLDSLRNIIRTGRIGMLFLIPGVDETLRVNGEACIRADEKALSVFSNDQRAHRVIVEITVRQAYLHCAKALMRSRLWSDQARQERSVLPTMGEMLADQMDSSRTPESQEEMVARYRRDL